MVQDKWASEKMQQVCNCEEAKMLLAKSEGLDSL